MGADNTLGETNFYPDIDNQEELKEQKRNGSLVDLERYFLLEKYGGENPPSPNQTKKRNHD